MSVEKRKEKGILQKLQMLGEESPQKKAFLSMFAASIIFLVGFQFLGLCARDIAYFGASLIIPLVLVYMFLGRDQGLIFAGISIAYLIFTGVGGIPTLYLHMALLSLAAYFLWNRRTVLIQGCGTMPKRLEWGVAIFLLMLLAIGIGNFIVHFTIVSEGERTIDVIPDLPLYLLVMSFVLAPVSEELFFRALLVPRAGVLGSTALFAIMHAAYGSMAGIAGAFILGLVLALAYRRLKDPVPCIIAHVLFNLMSVVLILWAF